MLVFCVTEVGDAWTGTRRGGRRESAGRRNRPDDRRPVLDRLTRLAVLGKRSAQAPGPACIPDSIIDTAGDSAIACRRLLWASSRTPWLSPRLASVSRKGIAAVAIAGGCDEQLLQPIVGEDRRPGRRLLARP